MANVGDEVAYVPEIDQALSADSQGNRVWSWKYTDTSEPVPEGERIFRRRPQDPFRDRRGRACVPDKPKVAWPATITAVNPDGTAALTIGHPSDSYQLHYPSVKEDINHSPGTWHTVEA